MVGCPARQSAFFQRMVPLIRRMARRLQLDKNSLLALCANEHGWEDAHNDQLHNLFGVTQAGRSNLAFDTDQAAADYWESHYGGVVRGSRDITDFVHRLRTIPYNTATRKYDQITTEVYRAVVRYNSACGFVSQ